MTSTQLIVAGLMIAAFISGWVARGTTPAAPAEETEERAPSLDEVAAAHEAVIDAWIDGADPDAPLARYDELVERTTGPDDVLAALHDSAEVFDAYRRGAPLTADLSRRLERSEDALSPPRPASTRPR